jgi:hypothetical protein
MQKRSLCFSINYFTVYESTTSIISRLEHLNKEMEKAKIRLTNLQDKYLDNEIKSEEYNNLKAKCNEQINNLIAQKEAFKMVKNDIAVQKIIVWVFWKIYLNSTKTQM